MTRVRLPLRGLAAVMFPEVRSLMNSWLFIGLIVGFSFLRRMEFVHGEWIQNALLILAAGALCAYILLTWRSYAYTREGDRISFTGGLLTKEEAHLHHKEISRVEITRDKWCLFLGLVNVGIYSEGDDDSIANMRYVTLDESKRLLGDHIGPTSSAITPTFFYKLGMRDALKASFLVSAKLLVIPGLIAVSVIGTFILSGAELSIESAIQRETSGVINAVDMAVEGKAAEVFAPVLKALQSPPFIALSFVLAMLMAWGAVLLCRLAYLFPALINTQIRVEGDRLRVVTGIFKQQDWSLPLASIVSVQGTTGPMSAWLGGRALRVNTLGSSDAERLKVNYIPYLPNNEASTLLALIGLPKPVLKTRPMNLHCFTFDLIDMLRLLTLPVVALVLLSPVSLWQDGAWVGYSYLLLMLTVIFICIAFRRHWNTALYWTGKDVITGNATWDAKINVARIGVLHGIETYTSSLVGGRLVSVHLGIPGTRSLINRFPDLTSDQITDLLLSRAKAQRAAARHPERAAEPADYLPESA